VLKIGGGCLKHPPPLAGYVKRRVELCLVAGVALLRCVTGGNLAAYLRREEAHLDLGVLVLRNAPGDDHEDHIDDEKEGCQPPRPRSQWLAWAIPAISVLTFAPPCVESGRQSGKRLGQTDLAIHDRCVGCPPWEAREDFDSTLVESCPHSDPEPGSRLDRLPWDIPAGDEVRTKTSYRGRNPDQPR
jgi:hypothetical protein